MTTHPRLGCCLLTVVLILAASTACAPSTLGRLPRGDWNVAASGTTHGTEVRYLTLERVEPVEPPVNALARLLAFLDEVGPAWRMPERIDYYAFPDRATLRTLTGYDTNARALLAHDATISIHAADAHEIMHLLTTPTERPLRLATFWMEGIAMFYTWPEVHLDAETLAEAGLPPRLGAWHGQTVHGNARAIQRRGDLPALRTLAHGDRAFTALPSAVSYPVAGSFVTHLLGPGHDDVNRIAAFQAFLDDANAASDTAAVLLAFERHMGTTLADAESAWHAFLDDWDEETAQWPLSRPQRSDHLLAAVLLLVAGFANAAVAGGSPIVFVGLLGVALWLVWLVTTGLRLLR